MKFILDEHGICLADVGVKSFCEHHLKQNLNVHVSQELIFNVMRAELIKMPIEKRPHVDWLLYGHEVFLDHNLRMINELRDPRMDVGINALFTLLKEGK